MGAALISSVSCKDFLVEDPKGQFTTANFMNSVEEVDMAVCAIYSRVRWSQNCTDPVGMAWQGDDITANPGSNKSKYANVDAFRPVNTDATVTAAWQQRYALIKACNYVINYIDEAPVDQKEKDIAKGQGLYWRAYSHFLLVREFGPVPLVTDLQPDYNQEPASIEEVYDRIVKDLTEAIRILPTDYRNSTSYSNPRSMYNANIYITQQAARATLCAVYMAMAGYPLNQTQYYASARDKANEVIQNGPFDLEDDFFNLWLYDNRLTNDEFIFAYYCNYDSGDRSYLARAIRPKEGGEGGWYDWCSSEQYLNEMRAYEQEYMTEEQKAAYTDGERVTGTFYLTCIDGTSYQLTEDGQPFVGKWRDGGPRNNGYYGAATINNSDTFYPVIRFSEVLLIYAEAANMAEGGPSDAAYDAINRVRTRVGLPELPAGMSASDFDRQVLNERKFEFAFECHRWSDICRRQLLPEVMKSYYPEITVDEHNYWLPKPYSQLGIWTGTVQNAGY